MMELDIYEPHLLAYFSQHAMPGPQEWKEFMSVLRLNRFPKGEVIERCGDRVNDLHLILEGIARHHTLDKDNEEMTIWISEPGGLSTDYAAFTLGRATQYQIQAVTPVTTVSITAHDLQGLYDRHKTFERIGRLINQQYLNDFIERTQALATQSARERFEALMANRAHLFNLVPLKHLASYMGMSLETLSRLRSNSYGPEA